MKENFYFKKCWYDALSLRTNRVKDVLKKNFLFLFGLMVLPAIGYSQYCTPSPLNYDGSGVTNVTIGSSINNNSTMGTPTYEDYSSQTAVVSPGDVVSISVTLTTSGFPYSVAFWIDWNDDFDFDDTDELAFYAYMVSGVSGETFTVPMDAISGTHKLRVGANDEDFGDLINPCYTGQYGNYEDYSILVLSEDDCAPAQELTATVLSSSSVDLVWTAPANAPNSYDIYVSESSTAPDGATTPTYPGVTETSLVLEDLIPNSTYYVYLRSVCASENSIWIGPVSFHLGYCIPTTTFNGDLISNFSTSGAIVNVNYSAGDAVAYTDNSSLSIQHYPNGSFDFSTTYVGGTNGVNIWIDWNNDFVFDESENVFSQPNNGATTTGSITIPDGTSLGDYRLRIRSQWGTGTNPPACGNVAWGETEDYTLTVIDAPTCIPPTGLVATLAQGGSSTLSWTASVSEPANGYAWFLVEVGAGPEGTQIASGTTEAGVTTAIANGLTDFSSYDLYVNAICGDGNESAWAGPASSPAPCTNSIGQYPSAIHVPVCNGMIHLVAGCAFAGEHALVQVEEGVEYIFTVSVESDIITIASEDNSLVYTAGIGSVTWTSTVTGNIRFYSHLAGCGTGFDCRDKSIQCGAPWVDEANVQILYTLGGLPLVFGDSHEIQALISNTGTNDWTKDITLNITGANTFTDVLSLELEVGQDSLITFAPFTATATGSQTVTVSVVDDNENDDNSYAVEQLVTNNLFSHKEPGAATVEGGVGIGGGFTGNFVAKFTSSAGEVNEIKVDFEGNGGVSYQYRVFAADGPDGLPGTVLFDSPVMVSAPGQAFLPVSPAVPVDGDFYVGLRELGTNFQFAYQDESPLRTGIFYFNTEDGTFPWTDISTSGAPTARLAIEAQMFTETAPNCAINTAPANGSVVCHLNETSISWSSGGGAPTGYHLYFGTAEDPEFVADVTETSYAAGILEEGTTYYWYVIPFNEFGEAEGCSEVLSFSAGMGGCYCEPTYITGTSDGDLISNVEILGTTLANNSGATPGGPAYTYYTGEPNYTADLQAGTSYTVSVTVGSFGGQNVSVWIDYNDNGIFEEEERVGYTAVPITGSGSATFAINLDCTAPLGMHRMRVRDVYNIEGSTIDPCAEYFFGETEDYDITITAPPACPTPYGGTLTYVTDVSATLAWNAGCTEELWNVHVGLAGDGIPTGDPSHPNVTSPLEVTDLTAFTNYEFWVMAICDDENSSDWAGPFFFSTLLLPPPVNDNPCGAIALSVSDVCNYVEYTNVDASNTPNVDEPSCSFYDGSDVWFSVEVPGNGIVTLDMQEGLITDAGMAIYSADTCNGVFTEIGCNDDDSPSGGTWMPYVELTDLEPNSTIYIRVFSYGNFEMGTFGICATSPCTAPVSPEIEVVNNTATITWPSMGDDASYNWEIRLSGEPGSGADGLVQEGTTDEGVVTITITDLEYLSIYNFYISTNCTEESTSPWSEAYDFATGPMPGCTNPEACNFNPDAGIDDGSCILEQSMWYADADGDGYGDNAVSEEACEAPEGYISNNTDCDDTDETVWQSNTLYIDADGDGYDSGNEIVCYGEELPSGYTLNTDGDDCNDEDHSVWEQSTLEVSLQLPVTTICHNSPAFTLTGGSPTGGTWSGSAGVSNGTFNPGVAGQGTHTITYTVAGDGVCTIGGSASAAIVVEVCPGVNEGSADDISLYPTYTNGNVTIKGTDLTEAIIMDINGKLIETVSLNNTAVISMQPYTAGIYFVRIIGENKVRTFKVIRIN